MTFLTMNFKILYFTYFIVIFCRIESQVIHPDCQESCGGVDIPYPFGTREGCFLNSSYTVNCNYSYTPPRLMSGGIRVVNISVDDAQMRILTFIAADCYNSNGTPARSNNPWARTTFPFSYTRNRFIAVGCDTSAMIQDPNQMTGCMSLCSTLDRVTNGTCSGAGCCQTSIPKGLRNLNITIASYYNHTIVSGFNPCSFSFLAADDFYNFSIADLRNRTMRGLRVVPSLLDWSVGEQTCEEAKNSTSYICGMNTYCNNSEYGTGYLCHCSPGYQGNPYLTNGCQDVDECLDFTSHTCVNSRSECVNIDGSYTCSCRAGYTGDGGDNGQNCTVIDNCISNPRSNSCSNNLLAINISVGIGVGLVVLIIGISFLYWIQRKRKHIKLKEKFFAQNGGFLLKQFVEQKEIPSNKMKIFTSEELLTATKNYDCSLIAGRGGYGTVYKGTLPDGTLVAIKKPKQTDLIIDPEEIKQFISEVVILSQVNNRNIVHLRGCCLETPSPILVYEFVTNGTLFEHLHGRNSSSVPWGTRLKIATQTAEVLSYLHSQAVIPIIHRDIKSTNILLDENFNSKVSDFGASRLVASDEMKVCTMVQGTLGYLDPEYLQTGELTEKSDVYSFGVVLVELLTGQTAVRSSKNEKETSLVMYFLSALKGNRLPQVLERRVIEEGNFELLHEVAYIAKRCLGLIGEERPSMKQVAIELEGLKQYHTESETVNLLGEKPEDNRDGFLNTAFYNVRNQVNPQLYSEGDTLYLLGEGRVDSSDVISNTTEEYDTMRRQVMITIPGDGR